MFGVIRLETRNCRGLVDSKKRWDVLDKIRKDNVHIACLQDVHLEKKDRNKLDLTISEHKIGPGLWKLNINLLQNKDLVDLIEKEVRLIKATYAATSYHPDYVESCPNKDIQLMINDSLFWETILVQLRGVLIKFAAAEKRKKNKLEQTLILKISKLEQECNSRTDDQHPHEQLKIANEELAELRRPKIENIMLRARAKWVEQGERSSKYFLQLEKSNCVNKTIKELEKEDTSRITDQEEILQYTVEHEIHACPMYSEFRSFAS